MRIIQLGSAKWNNLLETHSSFTTLKYNEETITQWPTSIRTGRKYFLPIILISAEVLAHNNTLPTTIICSQFRQRDLSVVGKISGVYKKTIANAAEIPNFPIILNAVLTWTNDTLSPAQKKSNTQNALTVCHSNDSMAYKIDGDEKVIRRSTIANTFVALSFLTVHTRSQLHSIFVL